jgi:mRNA interferase MazF
MLKRGQVCLLNLDPTVGSETQEARPCVVISPPEMHDHLRTVIVAPMSSGGTAAPFRIPVTHGGKAGSILPDQIRAVVKVRLIAKQGTLSATTLELTLRTLQEVFVK